MPTIFSSLSHNQNHSKLATILWASSSLFCGFRPTYSKSPHILPSSLSKISDTISGLQLSVSGPLTSMEELFTGSKPFLVSTRNCRRLSENVINLLSSISMARASVDAGLGNDSISGASIIPLTPVPPSVAPTVVPTSGLMPSPFSPGWAANTLMANEDYRWGCSPDLLDV